MKKMTRNEFLKMAGTSAALVVFNTVLMPAAVAVEPGVVALSSKKSSIEIDKGTTVNSAKTCPNFSRNLLGRCWFMYT